MHKPAHICLKSFEFDDDRRSQPELISAVSLIGDIAARALKSSHKSIDFIVFHEFFKPAIKAYALQQL
jgi:hypothetical protein